MDCRTAFKIRLGAISEDEMYQIIDAIGIDCGITENYLYYGLIQRDAEDISYHMFEQLHDTLSIIISKKELLVSLANQYPIRYTVEVKFTDIEDAISRNISFAISDEDKEFIDYIDAYYNFQNGYFDN